MSQAVSLSGSPGFLDATEWRIALLLLLVVAPELWDSANSSSELYVIQELSSRMPSVKASLLRLADDQALCKRGRLVLGWRNQRGELEVRI